MRQPYFDERNRTMKKYPLRLTYTAKTALWAGDRLSLEWGKKGESDRISETWELSVRPREMAEILNGEGKGMTLEAYFAACGADCVSPTYRLGDRFPLLVKLIDAADSLSVQVHPDDAYAARVEGDSGKTEMWYIVDAREGAELIYDLKEGVDREAFARAVKEKRIGEVMGSRPVHKGETYFIPAGMVHAIGKGILIAEIQQNSDLTYRIYDFDRRQKDGTLRQLHTEKAMEVVRPYTEAEVEAVRFARGRGEESLIVNCPYFSVRRVEITPHTGAWETCVGTESFLSLLCVEGEGVLRFEGETYPIGRGDSYFLPAGMGALRVEGELTLLASAL